MGQKQGIILESKEEGPALSGLGVPHCGEYLHAWACLMFPFLNFEQSVLIHAYLGFNGGANVKEPACQCRRHKRCGFDPWVGMILWRRAWQPTPVFLPGESHGQKSLVGTAHGVAKSRTWLLRQHRSTHSSCRCRICYSRAPFSTEETASNASSHPWG